VKSKAIFVLSSVFIGGGLVVGFAQADAPTELKAKERATTKEEIIEMAKDYPLNVPFTEVMSEKVNRYVDSIELNEVPSFEVNDRNVSLAFIDYKREDAETKQKIRFALPKGDLNFFGTYEKGVYPQELLKQSIERDIPILEHVKSLSDNAALNQLVDEAIEGLSAAASPYEYYESWAKLDAFVDQIGELSRQVLKPKN